jgi:hypothetical protein
MNSLMELKVAVLRLIDKYPKKGDELRDLYYLASDEIEGGGSEPHECDLAWRDMLELIDEQKG